MTTDTIAKPWLAHYEKGVPASLSYPNITLHEMFAQTVNKHRDRIATRFVLRYLLGGRLTAGGVLTYAQISDLVERFAAALMSLGVKKGDRVAIMLPNSPHFIIAFFAAARIGAIVVNTNPTYTARELKAQLDDSGAETIVLLNLFYGRMKEIAGQTKVRNTIVAFVDDTLGFPFKQLVRRSQQKESDWQDVQAGAGVHLFGELLKREPNAPAVSIDPQETALFQYTGGTTGIPKAAMLTHHNLVVNTLQVKAWLADGIEGGEKVMCAIPFFHVYGMTVAMLYGIAMGAEMVIVPNPRPIENVMRVIAHERCTIYPGVPAMYIGIVNHSNVAQYDLKSVKACISGSAALPMEVQKRFNAITGGKLVEGYGLTEASPVTHCNPENGENRAGSIGLPFPDTEAKLIDLSSSAGLPMDGNPDHIGELCVRGPQVMKGYWQQPEETAKTIDAEGWLHTGDVARMDDAGFFYIVDRKKDMINVSGMKVLPRDVEEVLFAHPAVLEASVIGVPHPTRGDDTLTAFVVLKEGQQVSADELKEYCKKNVAPFKVPRVIEFRKELPKTQVGKVLRRVLMDEQKAKQVVN
jgi:long-chain acyl-CoA synthetase